MGLALTHLSDVEHKSLSAQRQPAPTNDVRTSTELSEEAEASPRGWSITDAATHLIRGNLGPGCLALPYAFSRAGWVMGGMTLLVTIAQGMFAMRLLASCRQTLIDRGNLVDKSTECLDGGAEVSTVCENKTGLDDMAECVLGMWGRWTVQVFLFIVQAGVCCVYVSLVAENTMQFLSFDGPVGRYERMLAVLVVSPAFVALSFFRSDDQLNVLSKVGNLVMAVAVFASTARASQALHSRGSSVWISAVTPIKGASDVVMLAATTFYSFEGMGLVLPIQTRMAVPSLFRHSLLVASVILFASYVAIGVSCGVAYRGVLQTGSITAFLAEEAMGGPVETILGVVNAAVTAAVLSTFPLQLLPAADVFSKWLQPSAPVAASPVPPVVVIGRSRVATSDTDAAVSTDVIGSKEHDLGEEGEEMNGSVASQRCCCLPQWVAERLFLVTVFVVVTLLVQDVALLVSLFGAVGQTALAALPSCCHLAMMRAGISELSWWLVGLDVLVVSFCFLVMVIGTMLAMSDIVSGR